MPSFGGKRKGALLVAGLHREHLQLPQKGVERLPCQVCEIGKIVHFGRLVISQHDPGLEELLHGLLGGEAPVFLREGGIQAKAQAPQVASHDRQQQPGVFSWRHGAPSPRGPHRRRHASGSR